MSSNVMLNSLRSENPKKVLRNSFRIEHVNGLGAIINSVNGTWPTHGNKILGDRDVNRLEKLFSREAMKLTRSIDHA